MDELDVMTQSKWSIEECEIDFEGGSVGKGTE